MEIRIAYRNMQELGEQIKKTMAKNRLNHQLIGWQDEFDAKLLGQAVEPLCFGVMTVGDKKFGLICTTEIYELMLDNKAYANKPIDNLLQAVAKAKEVFQR